jgi:uncharacterized protein (TIGR03083 family)
MATEPSAVQDTADAYRIIHTRVSRLLGEGSPAERAQRAGRTVPSCPDWTVRDLLSHLVGVCSDILAGQANAAGSPEWTSAQVAARREQSLDDLLAEWATTHDQVAVALTGRSALGQVVMDALSHEYDLRAALGAAPEPGDPVLPLAINWLCRAFDRTLERSGRPALRLVTERRDVVLGAGEPAATLRAGEIDVLRSLTGRRCPDQIRALDWDGDSEPFVAALRWGPFVPPDQAVEPA